MTEEHQESETPADPAATEETAADEATATDEATEETAAPEPEGVNAQELDGTHAWIEGTIVEKAENVVVVSFERDGGPFTVTINEPRWNCDPSRYGVGDKIQVKAELYPGVPAHVRVAGQAFVPKA